MTRAQSKIVEIAYALKSKTQHFRSFHVAGIFRKTRLISLACNVKKSHPFALRNGYPFAELATHAECNAIIKAGLDDYSGLDMYILRINNNNELALSAPCIHCGNLLNKIDLD